ncbi:histidine kinase [Paenibacillus nasutitermitis]|uniref:Histidine kinase n=2 Tax=Paenibacillus nasutitermitis TaxID=1652958 RepID=A0A917DRU7_9BACL|nr:histidine kinase [Paenibacillus nasutitermitis]
MYISQATTNLDDFVRRFDQSTRSVLVERDIMRILSSKPADKMDELIQNKEVIQRFFSRTLLVYPEMKTITLVSSLGHIYHHTRAPDTINAAALQEQSWYRHIRDTERQIFITPVHNRSYYNGDKEGAAFTVGRVLWNYNGSYAGMILVDLDPSELIQLNKDFIKLGNRYEIRLIITNIAGEIIYHSDAAMGRRPWNEMIGQSYKAGDAKKKGDRIVLFDLADEGKLLISAEIPIHKLLAGINGVKQVTVWAIIACLVFIVSISFTNSYRITKPINELRKSMKQLELGHYSTLIQVPSSNDEISSLVTSYNKMILRIKELIEDVFISGMKRKQAKLLALQAQINPHMLFNTLESIRMKAVVKEQDEIAEMIKVLARMFKLSLGKERERNLVRHEVEYAANYIYLQNIRYDNRFTLEIRLSEEVLNTPIIPLVFQPVVENSIKHGFQNYDKRLHILIEEIRLDSSDALIRITDNGISISQGKAREINAILQHAETSFHDPDPEDRDTDSGIGLRNIAERLKLQYGERYYLKISEERGAGTVVELLIPLL